MGTGPANGRAGASLFAPLRAEEGEAWIDLKHCHADVSLSARLLLLSTEADLEPFPSAQTPQAEQAFERLFVSDDGANVKLASTTKPSEYLGTTK